MSDTIIHLFHIIIVGGLFLHVGSTREKIVPWLFTLLLILSIIIFIYHLSKAYNRYQNNKHIWVNLIHIIIVAPLLFYIGYNREKTDRAYFELLLMLGFASIGYHLYYLL